MLVSVLNHRGLLSERIAFLLYPKQGDGVACEKRVMDTACWACITVTEDTYEKSICAGFMSIMRYICQQNTSGKWVKSSLSSPSTT